VIGVFQLARERVAPLPQAFDLPLEVVRTVTHGASLLQSPTPVLKTAGNFECGVGSATGNPRAHTVRLQRNAYARDRVRPTSRN
jgi:hypothetical protein